MFTVRRGLAGKPAGGEDAPNKASLANSSRAITTKSSRAPCNSVGGQLGARKQCAVAQAKAGGSNNKLRSTEVIQLRSLPTNAEASGGGSLASHEIQWSDNSEVEEAPGDFAAVTTVGAAATPEDARPKRRPPQQHQPQRSELGTGPGAEPRSSPRRKPAGPAAALSGSAIATVRRRIKQGMPRAVAVAHAAVAAVEQPPPPPNSPASTAAVTASNGARSGGAHRMTAVAMMVVLVTAASAAGLLLTPSYSLRGTAAPPHTGAAWRASAGGAATAGATSGASESAGGFRAAGGLPYMAGWARLFFGGATRTAVGNGPRGRVVAAAVSSGPDRGSSGSRRRSALEGGGGPGLRQWWFGWAGAGKATSGTGPQPSRTPAPVLAAAPAGGRGDGAAAGGNPGANVPPEPQAQDYEWRESAAVRVVTIVHGTGATSPYGTSWESLAEHTAQRLEWADPSYQMIVFRAEQLGSDAGQQRAFLRALEGGAQLVVGLDVSDAAAEAFLKDPRVTSKLPGVALFVGGSETLARRLTQLQGGLRPQDPGSWRTALARRLPWTPDGRGLEVWDTLQLLLGRHDSDNFLFVYLVLINQYVTTVRQVADTTKGFDLGSLICMAKHCGSKVVQCVRDATCKSALDCLQACTFNDQVCQYRCIVSHESPLLEAFSLCILQLHNCRNLDAKPPLLPDPPPMATFRGEPLTHGTAEELFFGWLDEPGQGAPRSAVLGDRAGKPYSWLVAAGKNPAYDYFPCQHQLYYRGRGRGQVWYEPVFKAITLDGREVWRRRVYRVRRGKLPGTFHLSVLDNGVTSNEFWRVLDCEEDLQYCLFYYSGAASAAGLSYSGAVLGTPDGRMPGPQHTARLHAALRRAGIEPWELSYVDNSKCGDAPLQITGPVASPAAA
ncbi:Vitamin D3 receptor [Pleodorina starrii]|uniref:Vitamin D3 receptor n=1 Tax=Pleodorina starrii TaxID=330485 RepID=A0A9W6BPU3_9CHLO|nr:Vitamin D3 receptor [Pleodorina starrii]GLC55765.1 Vitamin D3 receptor [Pleodorina starrii]GLC68837.1 Vitamin D3 receptor [Pleodorina starrii]